MTLLIRLDTGSQRARIGFGFFSGCLVSSLEEARNDTAHDGNGRKAGYKINRYETTTQQHPTFWRPFAVVSAILFFRSISFSFFNFLPGRFFNLSFFLFVSAPWISSHYGRSTTLCDIHVPYFSMAVLAKRYPVVSNYSNTFSIFIWCKKFYIFEYIFGRKEIFITYNIKRLTWR